LYIYIAVARFAAPGRLVAETTRPRIKARRQSVHCKASAMSLRPARAGPSGAEAPAVAGNGGARLRKVLEIGYTAEKAQEAMQPRPLHLNITTTRGSGLTLTVQPTQTPSGAREVPEDAIDTIKAKLEELLSDERLTLLRVVMPIDSAWRGESVLALRTPKIERTDATNWKFTSTFAQTAIVDGEFQSRDVNVDSVAEWVARFMLDASEVKLAFK
jgi:hypothetical protein